MKGWTGKLIRANLTTLKAKIEKYPKDLALEFVGGRGFAIKTLWDEVPAGTDPLSPENKFIAALGPLAGLNMPNVGKTLVAGKSPLTGGYGDGNLGTNFSVHLRRSGYDFLIVEGKAKTPQYLLIEDQDISFRDADHLWGKGTFEAEAKLVKDHGRGVGTLLIGQGGEKLVKYAVVRSLLGRAGGRPGMGTIMGSKHLKAIVAKGTGMPELHDPDTFEKLSKEGYKDIKDKPATPSWKEQGTMQVWDWVQNVGYVLPTYNFQEGVYEHADKLSCEVMQELRVKTLGCPRCTIRCGHCIEDTDGQIVELDYENVALLGSNTGMRDLREVGTLNRLADDYGVDTISLGASIAFAMEASEKGLIDEKIEWGDFQKARQLTEDICHRRGKLGQLLADGTRIAAEKIGKGSMDFAMQIKGLEISGYDCHAAPGMALSFGVSQIGAHHKEAWIITWEIEHGREGYLEGKVDEVIRLQRLRGGMFENLVSCRFPWIEVGFELDWYPRYFAAATGLKWSLEDLYRVSDRCYSLIRSYWVREAGGDWSPQMDMPPARWFNEPLTKGPLAGSTLDRDGFDKLLSWYYEKRGWDDRGIPTKATLKSLGLEWAIPDLEKVVKLN